MHCFEAKKKVTKSGEWKMQWQAETHRGIIVTIDLPENPYSLKNSQKIKLNNKFFVKKVNMIGSEQNMVKNLSLYLWSWNVMKEAFPEMWSSSGTIL
jgi:hypothetical protein